MMQVPGYLGYSLLGDKSLVFVRSPHEYIAKQRDRHGDVFKGRILNKTQIFLTSNKATEDLLLSKTLTFTTAWCVQGDNQRFNNSPIMELKIDLSDLFYLFQ